MTPARRLAVASCLALGGVTSCGGGDPVGPTADDPVATGELRQFRSGIVDRTLQVTVTARTPLTATSVAIEAGGFASASPSPADVVLPAAATVDLPVTYGAADCAGRPGRATAVLGTGDGTLVLPLSDDGLLARLHAAECAERALAAAEAVVVDPDWVEVARDGRPAMTGTLRLVRRRAGERVVLDALGANVVFTVRTDRTTAPLLVLAPEQAQAGLRVTLIPTRCEAHALAESKRTSLLAGYLGLGDRPPRLTTITPDRATRDRLEAFAVRGCRTR